MKLETERLILRPLSMSDCDDIVEGAGEYDVAKMTTTIPHPFNRGHAEWFVNECAKHQGKASYVFAIELNDEKKVIGIIGLHNINRDNETATTGSWINKKYWRNGYITEAKIAVNDFAFNVVKIRRLSTTVITSNKASNATQLKVGYIFEGLQRKAQKSAASGKVSDLNMYGMLKSDWVKARRMLVGKK